MAYAVEDIEIETGRNMSLAWALDTVPQGWMDFTTRAEVREGGSNRLIVSFDTEVREGGIFAISLTHEASADLPASRIPYRWDFLAVSPSGSRETLVRGDCLVVRSVTAP